MRRRRRAQRSALAQRYMYQEGDEWWGKVRASQVRWQRVRQMLRARTQARERLRAVFYEYLARVWSPLPCISVRP